MDDKYQLTYDQFRDLGSMASEVSAVGEFFMFIGPEAIGCSVDECREISKNFGQVLSGVAFRFNKLINELDEEHIRLRKPGTAPIPEQ